MKVNRDYLDTKCWANAIAANVICGLVRLCSDKFVLDHAMEHFPKAIEIELNNLLREVERTSMCETCHHNLAG